MNDAVGVNQNLAAALCAKCVSLRRQDRTGEDEAMPAHGAPANCRQLVRAFN